MRQREAFLLYGVEICVNFRYMTNLIFIVLLSLAGTFLTLYIYRTKKNEAKTLVCPIGRSCEEVTHSAYSRIAGISVEVLGVFYYSAMAILYLLFVSVPESRVPLLATGGAVASAAAFLFTLYLIYIQAFVLKHWCSLCVIAAVISTAIFIIALFEAWPMIALYYSA